MNKKLKKLILSTVIMSLVVPVISSTMVNAKQKTNPINDKMVFIGNKVNEETLELVRRLMPEDENLKKIENLLEKKESYSLNSDSNIQFMNSDISIYSVNDISNLTSNDEIAISIEDIRSNLDLVKYIQECFFNGVKVYMYGENITLEEYKNLLNIDEIFVDKVDDDGNKMKFRFGVSEEEIIESKIGSLENKNYDEIEMDSSLLKQGVKDGEKSAVEKEVFDVIAYDMDGNNNKLILSTISSYNEGSNKKMIEEEKISNEIFLSNILDSFYETKIKDNTNTYGITYVSEAPAFIKGDCYVGSKLIGQSVTDWYMKRESSEGSTSFDYMALEDRTSYNGYNGNGVRTFWTDHDIPYTNLGDRITDWKPDESNTANHNISLSLGAGGATLNYSFSTGSKFTVKDIGSRTLGYGRWDATSYDIIPSTNVSKWYPSTSWLSTGRKAVLDIRSKGGYCAKTPLASVSYSSIYVRCIGENYGSNNN